MSSCLRLRKNWRSGWAGYCLICSSWDLGVGGRRGWDCDAGRVGLGTGAWARREEEVNVRAVVDVDALEGARKDCESRLNMVLVLDTMLFNVCPKVALGLDLRFEDRR